MIPNKTPSIILITGCSSGFGLLTAVALAAKGNIVYATMRDTSRQNDLLTAATKHGCHVIVRPLDVTKPNEIKNVVDEIVTTHRRIDVLINNAGYGLGGFFEDLTEEEIRAQMETNFFGVQAVTRAVIPIMRHYKQGKIINISSIAGLCGTPSLGAYNASKWALEGFSESLYHELSLFGIKVVLVEPGSYPTKIFTDNAKYAQNFNNPQSPYYQLSQQLRAFVLKSKQIAVKDPWEVVWLIERIVRMKNPKLRYISDFQSWLRVFIGKLLPASVYNYIFRKVIYGNKANSL